MAATQRMYKAVADVLREAPTYDEMVEALVTMFTAENPRFDADKFREAVQRNGGMLIPARPDEIEALKDKWQSDIRRIGDKIISEANENGWCSTVEEAMAAINPSLTYPLSGRELEGYVEWVETYNVQITRRQKVTKPFEDDEDDFANETMRASRDIVSVLDHLDVILLERDGIEATNIDASLESSDDPEFTEE